MLEKDMGRLRCPCLSPHLPCAESPAGGDSSHAAPQHYCCCPSPQASVPSIPHHPAPTWGVRLEIGVAPGIGSWGLRAGSH